jgi:hypothetical protein
MSKITELHVGQVTTKRGRQGRACRSHETRQQCWSLV